MEIYDDKAAELLERSYQTPEIVNQRLRTLTALAPKSGESIVDVGCGTGLLLEQEARAVGSAGRAEGLDFSDAMLAYARKRCVGLEQVGLQQGSAETLPFADAEFDALSCTQTLLYVKDMDQALREFYRVLKPHGRVAIIETDWSGAIINSHDPEISQRIFSAWGGAVVNPNLPRQLRPILAQIGFSTVRVEAVPLLNASYSEHSFSANMLENLAATAEKQSFISSEESKSWLQGIENLIQQDEYFFCVNRFLFTAVK
ncbi:MAG: methyltransferase domain-containing protein [Gammaproteobacteria bacterium]|nr:methyltransferase domain-containing protein [Gammaproteobacteria bacterium]